MKKRAAHPYRPVEGQPPDASAGHLRPRSLAQFGASLRRRREELGMTLDGLMAKTRISKPYLSNIETGRLPGVASEEKLRRIAKVLGIPEDHIVAARDWLRTPASVRRLVERAAKSSGDAVPRRPDGAIDLDAALKNKKAKPAPTTPPAAPDSAHLPLTQIPLINRVAAGKPSEYGDLDYPRGVADQYVPVPDLPDSPLKSAFALKVVGDSMCPEYPEGEILIVAPPGENDSAIQDGDDCIVRLGEEHNFATTFKRIFFLRNAEGEPTAARLVPLNPAHAERTIPMHEISDMYRILWRMRPGRR